MLCIRRYYGLGVFDPDHKKVVCLV